MTGYTDAIDFPMMNPCQAVSGGGLDAVVVKLCFDVADTNGDGVADCVSPPSTPDSNSNPDPNSGYLQ